MFNWLISRRSREGSIDLSGTNAARQTVLPKKTPNPRGIADTPTFDPSQPLLDVPTYRDHLENIIDTRIGSDSREIIKNLCRHDPDVSGTINAYLAIANSAKPVFLVYDALHEISSDGQKLLMDIMGSLFRTSDYSLGFRMPHGKMTISETWRYMLMMRGALVTELVLDKLRLPYELRTVDFSTIEFREAQPGIYKPIQEAEGGREINLDSPTIFINYFHRDPTEVYSNSYFVSAINTVAARQHLINTLYKIIQFGFPRITVEVVEEIARKSAPSDVQNDPAKLRQYLATLRQSITTALSGLRPEQALVHMDTMKVDVLSASSGRNGAEMRIDAIINTLNDQNQAALKTMSTVLGRGGSGVNTSSVEARLFAMYADDLNRVVADTWESVLTLTIRLMGFDGYVSCEFQPIELRPDMELEPQRIMRQTRLHKDLSLGLITDNEYHIKMYGRLPPDGVQELSGTGFLEESEGDSDLGVSPNSDPLGRSLSPEGSSSARSNQNN